MYAQRYDYSLSQTGSGSLSVTSDPLTGELFAISVLTASGTNWGTNAALTVSLARTSQTVVSITMGSNSATYLPSVLLTSAAGTSSSTPTTYKLAQDKLSVTVASPTGSGSAGSVTFNVG